MLKCNKQCARVAFRDRNVLSKVMLKHYDILKHQERLNDIKKDMRDDFKGCKKLRKIEPMYLDVNLQET